MRVKKLRGKRKKNFKRETMRRY